MSKFRIGSSTGRLPAHVVDFMKGARRSATGDPIPRLIPSETASGQIGMFPAGAYKIPRVRATPITTPPFRGGYTLSRGTGPASRAVLRTHTQQLARRAEKEQIAAVRAKAAAKREAGRSTSGLNQEAANAAIKQQFAMDAARDAGQMTGNEWRRTNNILMMRRRRALGRG